MSKTNIKSESSFGLKFIQSATITSNVTSVTVITTPPFQKRSNCTYVYAQGTPSPAAQVLVTEARHLVQDAVTQSSTKEGIFSKVQFLLLGVTL